MATGWRSPSPPAPTTASRSPGLVPSGSTFVPGRESRKSKRSAADEVTSHLRTSLSASRRALPVVAIAAGSLSWLGFVMLLTLSVLPPIVSKVVGGTLAIAGLILTFYGYATAVYIAFTEDSLYGMLFLLIPFYAMYYVFSRWDEMKSPGNRRDRADLARRLRKSPGIRAGAVGAGGAGKGRRPIKPTKSISIDFFIYKCNSSSLWVRRIDRGNAGSAERGRSGKVET